jgi:hypothetical protein
MESSYFKRCRAPEHWPKGRADDPLTHFEGPWQLAPSSMATAVSSPADQSAVAKHERLPMTREQFRRMALGFPGSSEQSHMGHPDFRVRGKIFATLDYPEPGWAMVKLLPDQQSYFVEREPASFLPASGNWGRKGSTNVRLKAASAQKVQPALEAAWKNVAPKALVEKQPDPS